MTQKLRQLIRDGEGGPRRKRILCRAAKLQPATRFVSLRRQRGLSGSGWDGVTGWAGAEVEAEGDGGVAGLGLPRARPWWA